MSDAKPEIAIWEDDYRGHTLAFAEILIRHIFARTRKPVLFFSSQKALRSDAYQVYLKPLEGQFLFREISQDLSDGKLTALWGQFRIIEKQLKAEGVSRLIVSTADSVTKMFGLARLLGWSPKGLDIHCCILYLGVAYPGRNGLVHLKDRFTFWLKRSAPVQASYLDQCAVERMREKFGVSLPVCPEPLYSLWDYLKQRPARAPRAAGEGIHFGFPGGARLGDRKGPDFLIDAFLQADLPSNSRLTFAGYFFDPPLLEKFEQARQKLDDRFKVVNGYLSTQELFTVVDQMDVVCLPYRNHAGTSAFFAQCATLGKVILGSDYGWLGWMGRKYNKMMFYEHESVASLARSLERAVKEFPALEALPSNYKPVPEEDFVRALTKGWIE